MPRLVWLLLAALAVAPGVSTATPAETPTVQQFLKIRTPGSPDLLPDGTLLVRDWPNGVWQLYRVRPDGSGSLVTKDARREPLTDFPDGLARYSVSPDGRRVVLMHARGGDENTQLTLVDLTEPARRTAVLTQPKVQSDNVVWLRDGSGFFYSANATNPNDFHVYRYDIGSGTTTNVLAKEGSWRARDVTSDGTRALVTRRISASEAHVYELDIASGRFTEITIAPKQGTASCEAVGYLPDERSVLLESDYENGSSRLYVRDLKSERVRAALSKLHGFELDDARINDRRDMLAVTTNEDGFSVLHAYTLPDLQSVPAPTLERGVLNLASFRGTTLVYTLSNARQPGTAYTLALTAKGPIAAPVAVTKVDDQGVVLDAFPLPELVRYTSFDGREIPALLFRPPGAADGPIPFVINYHGGPEGQSRPTFNATNQYLLSRGFGVLLPNVRGSTGYGRAYQMLDDYTKRWDSVKDGVAAAQWLVTSGHATPGKIAAVGGSYGGFMSVACVVEDQEAVDRGERTQRLFGACVDVVGIVNMKTFLERTSGYRRKLREAEYGPLTDTAFLNSVSSIHRADKIQVPIFIAHGFNDPRVPVEEAMQLAAALRAKGRQPRMFIAPDEGHGFQKLDNRIYYGERLAAFLEETLQGRVAADAKRMTAEE